MPQQSHSNQGRGNPIQDYVTVAERIDRFYERYPEGRIITHIIEHDAERGFILMRAEGYRSQDDAMPSATGHAFELRSEGYVNRTSYIENCESSSVGRMLALLGFEVKRGIASREEMDKAVRSQASAERQQPRRVPASPAQGKAEDKVTPKQLVAIRSLANAAGVDAEAECRAVNDCDLEALSSETAARFIDHLNAGNLRTKQAVQQPQGRVVDMPANRQAESPTTEEQISTIYSVAKAKNLDAELESMAMFSAAPERLTRTQAAELIAHLRNVRGRSPAAAPADSAKGFTRDPNFDPESVEEWSCKPGQRNAVLSMRRSMKIKHGITEAQMNKHALENAGIDDVTQLSEEQMASYIPKLSNWFNSIGKQ